MIASVARALVRPAAASFLRRAVATPKQSVARVVAPLQTRFASDLGGVLQSELEEEGNVGGMDDELTDMVASLKSKGVNITDQRGSSMVRLEGPGMEDEKIVVEFDCQDKDAPWDDDEDHAQQYDETDADSGEQGRVTHLTGMDEPPSGLRILASVIKGQKKMVFSAFASDKIAITGVCLCDANVNPQRENSVYQGPEFQELDDRVQDEMVEYLAERNIGSALAHFVNSYADYKEQTEYINWLKNVKKFVE